MAQLMEGDGGSLYRGLMGNAPGLPPRFPTLPNSRGALLPDLDNVIYSNRYSNMNVNRNHYQHRRSPSCVVTEHQPPWLDKLPEESEVPISRSSHRRSASDSFTWLENSESTSTFNNVMKEDKSVCQTSMSTAKAASHDKEDGDQLTDLLEEILQLQDQQNLPISVQTQEQARNSLRVNSVGVFTEATSVGQLLLPESKGLTSDDGEFHPLQDGTSDGDPMSVMGQADDPKKAKRVQANRQSAQRSRVRKLQYIAELERIVSTLQTEVSSLSLQVLYFKHQRALLNMDNNALKQQVVFFVQEKTNKDSQNELLMHDIRRLKELSEFKSLRQQQLQVQKQPRCSNIQRHSSLPSDFVVPTMTQESRECLLQPSLDNISGMMRDFAGMSLDISLHSETLLHNDMQGSDADKAMDGPNISAESSNGQKT